MSLRLHGEADAKAVPGVDGGDYEGQLAQLLFAELRRNFFVDVIRCVFLCNQCQRFGPQQCCALTSIKTGPGLNGRGLAQRYQLTLQQLARVAEPVLAV